jgi:ubiquinone/menaquinone biosynthesis C-methylase UbiE
MTDAARSYWNSAAATFDQEPDHGLLDPSTRAAWLELLLTHVPATPAHVADLGCGTGSLSILLAEQGYEVCGLDLADDMVVAAREKAQLHGVSVTFEQGDAACPPYRSGSFDVVLARHVLWAMPDPVDALERWTRLLRPGGRLILIEGFWSTGAGLRSSECEQLLSSLGRTTAICKLSDEIFWGKPITDERYLAVSDR